MLSKLQKNMHSKGRGKWKMKRAPKTDDAAMKLADQLSGRVAARTRQLGLTDEQLEQSAAEEIRKYRGERRCKKPLQG
jgi:hypothetical protein